MGIHLVENGEVGIELHSWFPSQASWTFHMKYCWLWNCIISVYHHTYVCFGSKQPQKHSIFLGIGECRGRNWWGWGIIHSWFPSQASLTFPMNKCCLWNSTTPGYNHAYTYFGPKQPRNYSVFLQNGNLISRKGWGWSWNPSMIPIPGFMNLSCESSFTLQWHVSSL